jgi:hypothetical protein
MTNLYKDKHTALHNSGHIFRLTLPCTLHIIHGNFHGGSLSAKLFSHSETNEERYPSENETLPSSQLEFPKCNLQPSEVKLLSSPKQTAREIPFTQ